MICTIAPALSDTTKNADFALHMEGSNADFAPHMELRQSFRDQKNDKMQFLRIANKKFPTKYILVVYMTYVTLFKDITILRESTFKNFPGYIRYIYRHHIETIIAQLVLGFYFLPRKYCFNHLKKKHIKIFPDLSGNPNLFVSVQCFVQHLFLY